MALMLTWNVWNSKIVRTAMSIAMLATATSALAERIPALSADAVRSITEARIAEKRAVGLVVALVDADGGTRTVSVGASGHAGKPLDADSLFEIGSITKAFTGTVLARLVEAGEVKLTDTVRMHAPAGLVFPPGGVGDITLLQLATHTSGLSRLPMSWTFFKSMLGDIDNPYKHYPASAMWAYLTALKHDASRTWPFAYSNLGFGLLGELLANRRGTTYEELVRTEITAPLGMSATRIAVADSDLSRFAIGHNDAGKPTPYWDLPAMPGAGALRSSARDMARFIAAQRAATLSGSQLAQQTHAARDERRNIGLAWVITKARGDEIVWHNGRTGGFHSFAGFSRVSGQGVVVLANSAVDVDDIGFHLINPAFPLDAAANKPVRPPGAFAALIAGLVWLSTLIMPFRTRFSTSTEIAAVPADAPKKKWTLPRGVISSRIAAAWAIADLLAIAGLLWVFAPWSVLPPTYAPAAKGIMLIGTLGAVLLTAWRARALATSAAAVAPKPGWGKRFGVALYRLVTLLVLAGLAVVLLG
ncbi:MAG: beta-lactamase family protein [Burkholderiales bacterium]|nr:beta-lactamase family protein [Burkholderiales bacterium]